MSGSIWVNVDIGGKTHLVNLVHAVTIYWKEPDLSEDAFLEIRMVNGDVLQSTHHGSVRNVIDAFPARVEM